ncbi:MAG: phosphoenolpyruvate--protein phosphotransferase [Halioglobus sp.]
MKALRGIAVSPGYANGNVVVYRSPMLDAVERRTISTDEVEGEFKRLCAALDRAIEEVSVVRQQVAADVGESEASIFDAHAAMLSDPVLKDHVHVGMRENLVCAEVALADEMQAFAKGLASSGNDYMSELAMDARDVGNRLLRHLSLDEGKSPLAELPPHSVIFARDLMPSETVGMDRKNVTGIATESGGPTSHAAILARSLAIPAVTGLNGLLDSAASVSICLLDGARGSLVLDPSDLQRRRFVGRRRKFELSQSLMRLMEREVCQLRNGTCVKLLANINQGSDVDLVGEHNLDGIGLYRTELMYLSAHSAPSHPIQSRHYNRAAAACGDNPVTIRTFDFAVEKHPLFLSVDPSSSLELRGLRFALRQSRLFKSQLRAIVRSAKKFPNLRILFPMVTGWWELKEALDLVKVVSEEEQLEHKMPIGAMIETPAAIFALPEIIEQVDFISIGCNDLAQYTLAMDRSSPGQTISECSLHPSLLRAIRQIVETADRENCPVGICGEAASDPIMAGIFVGLGIRELSVSPARAPVVRYTLRHLTLAEAKRAADCAIHADPSAAMGELQTIFPPELRSILAMGSRV